MLNKFRIEFEVENVECELIISANGYEDVKDKFFEQLKEQKLNGMLMKSHDLEAVTFVEDLIKQGKVTNRNIKRTVKLCD